MCQCRQTILEQTKVERKEKLKNLSKENDVERINIVKKAMEEAMEAFKESDEFQDAVNAVHEENMLLPVRTFA